MIFWKDPLGQKNNRKDKSLRILMTSNGLKKFAGVTNVQLFLNLVTSAFFA